MHDMHASPQDAAQHAHPTDPGLQADHAALLDLINQAKHADSFTAVASGDWFDPATWDKGIVPDADADVVIPHGMEVVYGAVSDTRLMTVAVEGSLHFATDRSSKMILDQLLTAPGSTLTIGTSEDPVAVGANVDIIIRSDVMEIGAREAAGLDPSQMGHGIVTHGTVRLEGAAKTDHLKVAIHPEAGDTTLVFDAAPLGWQVGDTLLVTAARLGRDVDGVWTTEDETVTIADIQDTGGEWIVTLDQPLVHDHTPPTDFAPDLAISVGNLTRNVTISSEYEGYADLGLRGHAMFMHTPDVEVRNAAFEEFGRTDKSIAVSDDNQIGRYALHVHRAGADADAAVLEGNVVIGSPGWGVVHHDSNVAVIDNVVFGVRGGGMIAETGNETGSWIHNLVVNTSGTESGLNLRRDGLRDEAHGDGAHQGIAYFFKSRMIESHDNIAVTAESTGYAFRAHGLQNEDGVLADFVDVNGYDPFAGKLGYSGLKGANDVPTRQFFNNEVYASTQGFYSSADKFPKDVDPTNLIENLLAWEVQTGIRGQYQEDYTFKGGFIIGAGEPGAAQAGAGGNRTYGVFTESGFEGTVLTDMEFMNLTFGLGGRGPGTKFDLLAGVRFDTVDQALPGNLEATLLETASADLSVFMLELDRAASDLDARGGANAIRLVGTRTDSLGTERIEITPQTKHWVEPYVAQRGFWSDAAGDPVVVLEFAANDTVTGSVGVLPVVIWIDASDLPDGAAHHGMLPETLVGGVGAFQIVDQRDIGTSGNQLGIPDHDPDHAQQSGHGNDPTQGGDTDDNPQTGTPVVDDTAGGGSVDEGTNDPETGTSPASIDIGLTEIETLDLAGYRVEARAEVASGDAVASLLGGTDSGTASGAFQGASGPYDLSLVYFDENDGAGTLSLRVDGVDLGAITLNEATGSAGVSADNLRSVTFADVYLDTGAALVLTGLREAEEYARVDTLTITPAADDGGAPDPTDPPQSDDPGTDLPPPEPVFNLNEFTERFDFTGIARSGGTGDDRVKGSGGQDILNGGDGDDRLIGYSGDDLLLGDSGDDRLNGRNGSDTLFGGSGDDLLTGSSGADTFILATGSGRDTVLDFEHAEGDRILILGAAEDSVSDVAAGATWTETGVTLTLSDGSRFDIAWEAAPPDIQTIEDWFL